MTTKIYINFVLDEHGFHGRAEMLGCQRRIVIKISGIQRAMTSNDQPWSILTVGIGLLELNLKPSELISERTASIGGIETFRSEWKVSLGGHRDEGCIGIIERVPHVLCGRIVHMPASSIDSKVIERRITT